MDITEKDLGMKTSSGVDDSHCFKKEKESHVSKHSRSVFIFLCRKRFKKNIERVFKTFWEGF
jgi:hypothetical protein